MKKAFIRVCLIIVVLGVSITLSGCAELQRKFTRKKKADVKQEVYYQVRDYNVKPSLELYEKHYVFWVHWQRAMLTELGENHKRDMRSINEITGNLEDMAALLVDEKTEELLQHIEKVRQVKAIIEKNNMTKVNETRIRHILERVYRTVRNKFSPSKMSDFIRREYRQD